MARPKSPDPKVSVTLSIRRSTREAIAAKLQNGQTVGLALSAAVEAKYGGPTTQGGTDGRTP